MCIDAKSKRPEKALLYLFLFILFYTKVYAVDINKMNDVTCHNENLNEPHNRYLLWIQIFNAFYPGKGFLSSTKIVF